MSAPWHHRWRKIQSGLVSALCLACAVLVIAPLALVLLYLLKAGPVHWTSTSSPNCPSRPAKLGGGMANAMLGSFVLVLLAAAVGVPIGVLGGVYLAEFGGPRLSWAVRFGADILNGTPSIVWGIVI